MPSVYRLPGQFVGANLNQPAWHGPTRYIPANLGVEPDGPEPPDPPDPPWRGLRVAAGMPWRPRRGPGLRVAVAAPWRRGRLADTALALRWRARIPADERPAVTVAAPWRNAAIVHAQPNGLCWRAHIPADERRSVTATAPWHHTPVLRSDAPALAWSWSQRVSEDWWSGWRFPPRRAAAARFAWQESEPLSISLDAPWHLPPRLVRSWRIPWGQGTGLPWSVVPPPPPPKPPPPIGRIDARYIGAHLGCPAWPGPYTHIPARLGSIACYNVRPRRKVYVVRNSISVVRLPDRLPVQVLGGDISIDVGSWAAAFTLRPATLADLQALQPATPGSDPRQFEITLNGHVFTGLAETWAVDRRFADPQYTITGRSRTAMLSAPYAPPRTWTQDTLYTARQLAERELMDTGYTLTWDTVDWTVQPGTWSYADLTPADAIARVAAAVGAVVQSDPEAKTLHVRPRYPVSPWDWTVSPFDVSLTDDLAELISERVNNRPPYTGVFISGEHVGVSGFCKIAGTDGTTYAPQMSHPLIVDATAHQEAGRQILSDRGRQTDVTFADMPLHPAPALPGQAALYLPLQLLEVTTAAGTWHGMVTRNSIRFEQRDAATVILQTINIERHPEDAD